MQHGALPSQMCVGFFSESGDYADVGSLFNRLSAEYPKTWFYAVDTTHAEVGVLCRVGRSHDSRGIR